MARYRRSYSKRSKRAPIKSTKTYKKGMWQIAGITTAVLAFFPQVHSPIIQQANKLKAMFMNGGGA